MKINLNSKDLRTALLVLAVVGLLLISFFGGRSYQKQKPSESEKYLQEQVEQYQQELETWKERFTELSAEREKLEEHVESLEKQVKSIREYYDQKIIVVKSYSYPELEQFFADRYPD